MLQAMRFANGTSAIDISEAFSNNIISVYVYAGGASGTVEFDERRLIEMRNWINRQLVKIKKNKQPKVKTINKD